MSQISQYENYKTESGTPYSAEEQATFESTGVVPVSGKYHEGDTSMVTKSINLNDIISSGFPEHTQLDAGKVLGVKNDGTLEWVEKLPAHDVGDKDKVLTVTGSHGDTVEWVTPSGGGGGDASYTIVDVNGPYNLDQDNAVIVPLPSNKKIFVIHDIPDDNSDIKFVTPTLQSGEILDLYVDLTIPDSDTTSHYYSAEDSSGNSINRIADCGDGSSYSTVTSGDGYAFLHFFYKYFDAKCITTE